MPNSTSAQTGTTVETGTPGPLDVHGLICVEPPYFALRDLRREAPGEVTAEIPVEADGGRQATPIGISEIGRHLAIAGLCAAATVNPREGRHFYLARAARGSWHAPATPPGTHPVDGLIGRAGAAFSSPRRVAAGTCLTSRDGTLLATLDVEYDVLAQPVFERVLGDRVPDAPVTVNPYSLPMPLRQVEVRGGHGSAALTVTPEMCPGHFAGHPVLPVATLSVGMTTLIDHVVAARGRHLRWLPVTWFLSADKLVHAGETVVFEGEVTYAAGDPKGALGAAGAVASFRGTARVGSETVAEAGVDLLLVDDGVPGVLRPASPSAVRPAPHA
ncbi:hypothetical protein [Streptomyces sp. NBC_00094]|uniref:hypothetical protein n=1 Tax=Streptomyces sp. NBC_00094 TaxID=2903620 RepID=UPI00225138BD|nr:hypothetical protein [Streptomyces sp. NBC_00094]MCX5393388.1 hypothetical protein [Streptomyces sp. NBC_00094]